MADNGRVKAAMTNIPILGWYNQQNVGDEAFKDVFRAALREVDPSMTVSFHAQRLESPVPPKIILGGGDVIRPHYLQKIPPEVRVVPMGAGLGYESEIELLANVRVPFAVFRNRSDVELAKSRGIAAEYVPDLTYFLDQPEPLPLQFKEGKSLAVLLSDEISPTFERKMRINELQYYEYFKWEFASVLDFLADYYNIYFIAFSILDSINDHKVSLDIYRRMSNRSGVSFISQPLSMAEALWVIKHFDLVISMKFHGIMFAVNQGIPFINIAETRKTQRFCVENHLGDLTIPRYSLERERFLEVVKIAEAAETQQAVQSTSARLRYLTRKRLPEAIKRFLAA
jgi:polysaccharide pyruvyl transferase WcaK-like protein